MRDRHDFIFRPDALQRYRESREGSALPRLVCPRLFLSLWILWIALALLLTSGVLAWFLKIRPLLGR